MVKILLMIMLKIKQSWLKPSQFNNWWLSGRQIPLDKPIVKNPTVTSKIAPLTLPTQGSKAQQKEIRNISETPSVRGELIFLGTFPVFALCASAYKPPQHKPCGRLSVSFWTIVSHLFIGAWHNVDTACHPLWHIPAGAGGGGGGNNAICRNPSKDTGCL